MNIRCKNDPVGLICFLIIAALLIPASSCLHRDGPATFIIKFGESLRSEPTTGRILLLLSRSESFSIRETGTPIYGISVEDMRPGDEAVIDENAQGYPVRSIQELPAGEYYAQAYFNIYTTFDRSDGHRVQLHMDQGEGQNWRRSPGNLFCEPVKIQFDPEGGDSPVLVLDKMIPPIPAREDSKHVRHFRIESKLLTEFWGQPMHLGARVLIPKGFEDHPDARYPVHYNVGHFPRGNPGRFSEKGENEFSKAWLSDGYPRFIMVTIEHATPYYDDSYGVNSENNGPYGDAIVTELIPQVEEQFRAIGKPHARVLSGGSTGGWIALGMQVFYPDFFGGCWASYPDQVDFRYYQIVNVYEDKNAYFIEHEWTKVPRGGARGTDGNLRYLMEQENLLEEVIGDRYRSGGQWAIWNAVFAPVDEDGYPKPLWNPITGKIDQEVAEWAKENYDLRYILERDWKTLGPKLAGKIHIFCGRMDNYYLNEACYLLEEFLEKTQDPYYGGEFRWGDRGGHGWSPWGRSNHLVELHKVMAEHIKSNAP
jgi:hypothetical protein